MEAPAPTRSRTAFLVAISGIDGAGKGHVTAQVAASLQKCGVRAAALSVDPWLRLPHERFDAADPARHFYERALRFDEMFGSLVLPLRNRRSVYLEADAVEETSTAYRRRLWLFEDVDVILLEGIYLFKSPYRRHYDFAVWLDCSFETALARAVSRAQEGLSPDETERAYRSIYFPAQEIHLALDDPRGSADVVLSNDDSGRPPAGAVTDAALAAS
jgi:uridine kinase